MLKTLPVALATVAHVEPTAHLEIAVAMVGAMEMALIFGIVVILFGATKLPQLGKGMGEAIGNFKKAQRGAMTEENRNEVDGTPKLHDTADSVDGSFEKENA